MAGCGAQSLRAPAIDTLPPLQLDDRLVSVAQAPELAPTPDLLALSDAMRDFVERYTRDTRGPRQRLVSLHEAVRSPAMLDLQYDPFADGTAEEAFRRGSANCLSYAHLFVALAREAGLDARYQEVELRPQWTRLGERVARELHVNVVIHLPRHERVMADIDPLQSRDVATTHPLSDADAAALFHSNAGISALGEGDLAQAWLQTVRALQLSPAMAPLWVNLGAIYRTAGQTGAAEQSYFQALQLDAQDRSAMNNLMILYQHLGQESKRAYWAERVARDREANPFYHAFLGDQAGERGDWDAARDHYQRALQLRRDDSHFLYALGIIHYERGDFSDATRYIARAIERATLRSDIDKYRLRLKSVQEEATASL